MPEAEWVVAAEGSRADGSTSALQRELLAQHPELATDASIELRLDTVCSRDGVAHLRIWKRPRIASPRRKPRHLG